MPGLQSRVMEEQVIDWIAERAKHTEQELCFHEVDASRCLNAAAAQEMSMIEPPRNRKASTSCRWWSSRPAAASARTTSIRAC